MYTVLALLLRINPCGTAVLHDEAEPSRLTLKFPVPKTLAVNNMVLPWHVVLVNSFEFSSNANDIGMISKIAISTMISLLFINYNPLLLFFKSYRYL